MKLRPYPTESAKEIEADSVGFRAWPQSVLDTEGNARPRNNAFEGEHLTPSGAKLFKVYYLDRTAVRDILAARKAAGMRVYPPGHHLRLKTGWFWNYALASANGDARAVQGPYSSSRRAYEAAVDKIDNGKG